MGARLAYGDCPRTPSEGDCRVRARECSLGGLKQVSILVYHNVGEKCVAAFSSLGLSGSP